MRRLALLTIAALVVCIGCQRTRFTYEVPNGYVGWVNVSFDPTCREDASNMLGNMVKVRRDGTACSRLSSHPKTTWVRAYYVDKGGRRIRELPSTGWGEGGMQWAEVSSLDGRSYRFFVGTEQQLLASWEKGGSREPAPATER